MAEINTAENLRLWLKECPAISDTYTFNVDFMGTEPVEYALFSSPTAISYERDILGNVYVKPIQELQYIFAALFPISEDVSKNLENLEFFTDVMNWIYQQNMQNHFPQIEEGTVLSIMPDLSPHIWNSEGGDGRYQIQLKIRYRRKSDINQKG